MFKEAGQSTSEIRNQLDVASLQRYLEVRLARGVEAPLEVRQFNLGQSNPTYLLKDARSHKYVLRKKPAGTLLSGTAHAVEREYLVMKALGSSGKRVPVPNVYLLCEDSAVIGTTFYIMEFVEGRIFSDVTFPTLTPEGRRRCWFSAIEALAALHSVDYRAVGLEGYGKPSGFYARQIRSLRKVSKAQAAVRHQPTGEAVGEIPHLEKMLDWFQRNQVEDATAIIHD